MEDFRKSTLGPLTFPVVPAAKNPPPCYAAACTDSPERQRET